MGADFIFLAERGREYLELTEDTSCRTCVCTLPLITMAASDNEHLVQSEDPDHPANLIPRLCRQFYTLGKTW